MTTTGQERSVDTSLAVNPYLHYEESRIYNPLTDRALLAGEPAYASFRLFQDSGVADGVTGEALVRDGWLVRGSEDLSRRFHLKIVSLETVTTCNQKCYFCPVSVAPRDDEEMPTEVFERIVEQLKEFRGSIDGVFLQSYNEPTIDRRFVDHCRTLMNAGLPVAVLSNGSGLTPAKSDALLKAGKLRYLCINLSTLDAERYERDRGENHVRVVMRNIDHAKNLPLADEMRIIVLGSGDEEHRENFEAVRERYAGSNFEVQQHLTVDRGAWHLEVGKKAVQRVGRLAGCELIGSRPLQHLHITATGDSILCCQDYDENYVVGNLKTQTVREVLEGDEMARMRRMAYGVEDSPEDFICRSCVFAITR
ncbi:MAG TPA: radical SAM/SPASM domain-containing protein [Thermoanaerobaculia bacterium]|nr:radical SAM/SPASM domain-containing protein [Thermoanaerobaculia bacterium]